MQCNCELKGNGKVKFFMAPPIREGYRCPIFVKTSPLRYIVVLVARYLRRPASEITVQK